MCNENSKLVNWNEEIMYANITTLGYTGQLCNDNILCGCFVRIFIMYTHLYPDARARCAGMCGTAHTRYISAGYQTGSIVRFN